MHLWKWNMEMDTDYILYSFYYCCHREKIFPLQHVQMTEFTLWRLATARTLVSSQTWRGTLTLSGDMLIATHPCWPGKMECFWLAYNWITPFLTFCVFPDFQFGKVIQKTIEDEDSLDPWQFKWCQVEIERCGIGLCFWRRPLWQRSWGSEIGARIDRFEEETWVRWSDEIELPGKQPLQRSSPSTWNPQNQPSTVA